MSISEDDLRAGLRHYAEQAGPAGFPTEPVIRRAGRRRVRFMAAAGCCAVAVAAAAVVVAAAVPARPMGGPDSYVPPISPGPARNGPWPTSFGCGQPLPAGLPGAAGYALRISVGPIARAPSGQPDVTWYMAGTEGPEHVGPAFGKTQAIVLIVRDDGTIVAVERAGPSPSRINIPLNLYVVPASEVERTQPRIVTCQPPDWSRVWANHQQYGVVVLLTAWVGYPGANPARFGAAAALPSG